MRIVLLALLIASACAGPQHCNIKDPAIRTVYETSYRVIIKCGGEVAAFGSAVAVAPERALTARHVVELDPTACPMPSWILVSADGTLIPAVPGPAPGDADVASLVPASPFLRYAIVRKDEVELGETLTMFTGHGVYLDALPQSFTIKHVLASGYYHQDSETDLILSGHIVSGNSGSGVFDDSGRLVGILSKADSNSDHENYGLAVTPRDFP
jgi:hypothetical protein